MPDYNLQCIIGGGPVENGVYSVLSYGAVGDGTTDDTTAIQAAVDAVEAAGAGEVYFPPLVFVVSDEIVVAGVATDGTGPKMSVNLGQAVVKSSKTDGTPILHIGSSSADAEYVNVIDGSLRYSARNFTAGASCILLENAYRCRVYSTAVQNGHAGIELRGSNASYGTTYNDLFAPVVRDCLNSLYYNKSVENSFVNENKVFGGQGNYSSSLNAIDCSTGFGINMVMTGSANRLNGNKFYGYSIECGAAISSKPGAINYTGNNNFFDSCRFEGFATPLVTFSGSSDVIEFHSGYSGIDYLDDISTSDPEQVRFTSDRQMVWSGGTDGVAPAVFSNTYSAEQPAVEVKNTTHATTMVALYGDGVIKLYPSAAPGTPVEGMLRYDSATDGLQVYNGSAWEAITTDVAKTATAADGDATPTVAGIERLLFDANTGALEITQLDDGVAGQELILMGTSATNPPSILDAGNFKLNGGSWSGGTYTTLHLITTNGSTWVEVSRAAN